MEKTILSIQIWINWKSTMLTWTIYAEANNRLQKEGGVKFALSLQLVYKARTWPKKSNDVIDYEGLIPQWRYIGSLNGPASLLFTNHLPNHLITR